MVGNIRKSHKPRNSHPVHPVPISEAVGWAQGRAIPRVCQISQFSVDKHKVYDLYSLSRSSVIQSNAFQPVCLWLLLVVCLAVAA